jgi:hypothetical protein
MKSTTHIENGTYIPGDHIPVLTGPEYFALHAILTEHMQEAKPDPFPECENRTSIYSRISSQTVWVAFKCDRPSGHEGPHTYHPYQGKQSTRVTWVEEG